MDKPYQCNQCQTANALEQRNAGFNMYRPYWWCLTCEIEVIPLSYAEALKDVYYP